MSVVRRYVIVAPAALFALAGCHADAPPFTDGDTDSSTDSDVDSDADSDADSDPTCPWNSGWPCTCDAVGESCDDGSTCRNIPTLGGSLGVCMFQCTGQGGYCPETDWPASESCGARNESSGEWFCLLSCLWDEQCPPTQICAYEPEMDEEICYPASGDADTDTDTDTDTDSDSDSEVGQTCENPIEVPDGLASWEYTSNWSEFQSDTFDGSLPGCSDSGGTTAWFEVDVPAGDTIEISRSGGANVGINVLPGCESSACFTSGSNSASWKNDGYGQETISVAVETEFAISQAALELLFERTEGSGETCNDAASLDGGPLSANLEDYLADQMPASCGNATGPDAWFDVEVPAFHQVELFCDYSQNDVVIGYSLDCASCEKFSPTESSLVYTNDTDQIAVPHFFVKGFYPSSSGEFQLSSALTELPAGDVCADAIPLDAADLPHSWTGSSPLFTHDCSESVCPDTSGPDVWHSVQVPAGQVLTVNKTTSGPDAYMAVLDACGAQTPLKLVLDPDSLVWQNSGSSAAEVYVVTGAVSADSLALLGFEIEVQAPAAGDFCGSAIAVPDGVASWSDAGSWNELGDWFSAGAGCAAADGPEVWYRISLEGGESLLLTENSGSDVAIQLLAACGQSACLASSGDSDQLAYVNPYGEPTAVYAALESVEQEPSDDSWQLLIERAAASEGDVCSNPIPIASGTTIWSGSWTDFGDSGLLEGAGGCGGANGRDAWFAVEVPAGRLLLVEEQNFSIPNLVHSVEGCSQGDGCFDSGADQAVWHNVSGETAEVLIAVEAVSSTTTSGAIELELARQPITAGDACSDPNEVAPGELPMLDDVSLWGLGSAWPSSVCTPAEGADVWYRVDVPDGRGVFFSEHGTTDVALYLADGCPPVDCLASADEPERINWINQSGSTVPVFAAARAVSSEDDAATLSLELDVRSPSQGDYCGYPIDLTTESYPIAWDGDLSAFSDGFSASSWQGCLAAEGRELWFELSVPASGWLSVEEDGATATAIHLVEDCAAGACVASGSESATWHNGELSAVDVLVAVEGLEPGGGSIDLAFEVSQIPPTTFGPDGFGYLGAVDEAVDACPEISASGTDLGLGDDDASQVELAFAFELYGVARDSVHVSSNGLLSFDDEIVTGANQPLPAGYYDGALIAPFWDDLNPSQAGGVFVQTIGETLVVQWLAPPFGSSQTYDIRAVLDGATGNVHFCYADTTASDADQDHGASATCAIQGDSATGLQYSYNDDQLVDGTHVWFIAP